ncbi:hypothetical protein J2X36_004653 [Methylobacterium sp. BE186]|uniref:hypothetical protein n=1 Tax=Methylobacterium sp. BE186 TaxID=2817715 RepID=UPI00285F4A5B|nr:hypothetical protein [Methylobacterium sp. BE186]MDR7039875.1 hypothetical protein [Methylobacterium sp. BE186]
MLLAEWLENGHLLHMGWRFTTPYQEAKRAEAEGHAPPPLNWRGEARFWLSREPYTGGNRVVLLQLVITLAVGIMAMVNLVSWARYEGGWVAAASSATLFTVMVYPYVRHRIERGYWPD